MQKKLKKILAFIFSLILLCAFGMQISAYSPYENYTFDASGKRVSEPQAVIPVKTVDGSDIGVGHFSGLSDIYIRFDTLYLVDSGNNRIVITDKNFNLIDEITSFDNGGVTDTFNSPKGIFVTEKGEIFVCDTGKNRIVALDKDKKVVMIITAPKTELLEDGFAFMPLSVSVDNAGRIFAVAENVNQGIIEFDKNGNFQNFFGPIQTQPDLWKSFIKMFATKEQKAQMTVTVPTEYSNIDINSSGFVYGTVAVYDRENFSENMLIHKLNPIGNDILERNGYASPMGDVDYRIDEETGEYLTSKLIDIKSFENQFYSVLDERNGRVFTYSEDGFLLFVFGALGQNLGQFKKPSAIEVNGNNFYVTDSEMNYIIEYQLTDYGSNIKNAVLAEGDMEYEKADEYWGKVLQNTAKSSFTYNRIGMSALKNGDYSQAMKYLKLAENRADYSTAYKYVRDTFFDKYFSILAIVLIGVILFIIFIKIIKGRRNKQ